MQANNKKRQRKHAQSANFFSTVKEAITNRRTKRYKIDGEDLPTQENNKDKRFFLGFTLSIVIFGFLWVMLNTAKQVVLQTRVPHFNLLTNKVDFDAALAKGIHVVQYSVNPKYLLFALLASILLAVGIIRKFGYATKQVAYGQKGDSRFTTIQELKDQYPMIPDHDKPSNMIRHTASFDNYGGIPISHYKRSYFIDRTASHNIVVGTSRSGKGQTTVIPMIDILSRAQKQSSLVVNDPKGELYAAASETLRKRGYNVYLLNLADGSQGMAYNPLQLIVRSWLQGDTEGAMQLVNSLTYTLYHEENAGANSWVYEGAQKAVNGMIIALIEYCIRTKQIEKITLNNIIDMVNEMGTVDYAKDPNDPYTKTNILDEFFKHLKQGSIAKREFGSTSFSGEKAKGSIYSTIVQKLSIFSMPKMARMTSKNSIALKSVGFPKYINLELDKTYANRRLQLIFLDKNKKLKARYTVKASFGGFVEYNFADTLQSGEYMLIRFLNSDGKKLISSYKLKISSKTDEVKLKQLKNTLKAQNVKMHYSDKPTAIFMKIPDYDSSNNALASIFTSQLYSELAKQCSFVAGGKTIKRVHYIFDEFGNMLPIKDMDQIMTVSAGRNMLFTLIIQSYQQLFARYGREKGQVIKENGQNQILIKSTDDKTNQEFSREVGNKTVEGSNVNKSMMNTSQSVNVSADSVPLISTERLKDLMAGESVVLRPLYRQDLKGRSIRPFPIFNTKELLMPYAYTFLTDEFDPDQDPALLDIDAPHAKLDLAKLAINWRDWITWSDKALKAYDEYRQEDQSHEDAKGSDNTPTQAAAKEEQQKIESSKPTAEKQSQPISIETNNDDDDLLLAMPDDAENDEFDNLISEKPAVKINNHLLHFIEENKDELDNVTYQKLADIVNSGEKKNELLNVLSANSEYKELYNELLNIKEN